MGRDTRLELGWCDICLRATNVKTSRAFYEKLGFRRVEGIDEEGWAVMTNGDQRLGLYEPQHTGEPGITINFRGGDVLAIAKELQARGLAIEKGPIESEHGCSAWLRDPDGYSIFLDTGKGETKKE